MDIKNKKIIAIVGIFVLLFIFGYWLFPKDDDQAEYIFDKSYNISLEDVKKSRRSLPQIPKDASLSSSDSMVLESDKNSKNLKQKNLDLNKIFAEGLINSYTTFKYFKHLEHLFRKSMNLGEHFDQVREYLFSEFSESEAQELFETYKNYLTCEMDLLDEFRNLTSAKSTEEAIRTLKQIQEFRRDRLGVELADKLFGADVKAKEYAFRRADIIGDETLYGSAKEEQIKQLNEDMWGEDAQNIEKHPNDYNRYKEKIKIYKKDFDEIESEDMREAKIKEFRNEFFTPEIVERLEGVDRQIAAEKQNENDYREKEKQLLNDTKLTQAKKDKKLIELQNEKFGKEADAFRRRETMRIERDKLIRENKNKIKR